MLIEEITEYIIMCVVKKHTNDIFTAFYCAKVHTNKGARLRVAALRSRVTTSTHTHKPYLYTTNTLHVCVKHAIVCKSRDFYT